MKSVVVRSLVRLSACVSSACVSSDQESALGIKLKQDALIIDGNYAGRNYKLFVPSSYSADRSIPLVMMLHGCSQDPAQFATGTQMNALGESERFLVVYPEQPSSANIAKCWDWFATEHQARGSGQPAILAGLVSELGKKYNIDSRRVYVGGLSAGAAMAVILGATYPDVFAAIAVGSGLEYKATSAAMRSGGPSPANQGVLAYRAMGTRARTVPVIVFHGSSDGTVVPVNGDQVISQWAKTNDLASDGTADGNISDSPASTESGTVRGGRSYTRSIYRDRTTGSDVMIKVMVSGMGHAWSGGSASGSFTDPKGPDASKMTWDFFRAHPQAGSVVPDAGSGDLATVDASIPDLATPPDLATRTDLAMTPADLSMDLGRDLGVPPDLSADLGQDAAVDAASGKTIQIPGTAAESGFVGQYATDGISSSVLKVGDKGMYNGDTYRTIVSFDISSLAALPVKTVELVLFRKSQSGSVSGLTLDAKSGFFGKSAALAQEDYAAAASHIAVAAVSPPGTDGAKLSVSLPVSVLREGNKLQVRIRASTPIDFPSDTLELHSSGTLAPTLVVTY